MTPSYVSVSHEAQPERHDEEAPILPANGTSSEAQDVLQPPKRHWLVQRVAMPAAADKALSCLDGLASDDRTRSTVLINFSCIMERVDEQLLPSLYRFVGKSFQATPSQLGILTLSRALVQALASPLAGILGHYVDRVLVLVAGAVLWGTMTAAFSTCKTVSQGIPFWAMNGVGLSLLIPAAQSLTADYNVAAHRGKAFGLLAFTGSLGALMGTMFATNIGGKLTLGVEGWRFAFLAVAVASWTIGVLTWLLAVDPRYTSDARYRVEKASEVTEVSARATAAEIWRILRIPSFGIIILQGIVGTTPWYALAYMTLYLQLVGMSDLQASSLMATFLAASAAGSLLGGCAGDWAAKRWPNHGRVAVCQLSVASGVPLSFLMFKGLPLSSSKASVAAYGSVMATAGLAITWAGTACNNPIFSEIVPAHMRNLVYAWDRSFEGAVAACGAPLVGWLAEAAFGFQGTAETGGDAHGDLDKARSLGSAMLVITALPWALCALFFSGLHWSYPRDKRRAEEEVLQTHPAVIELAEEGPAAVGGVGYSYEAVSLPAGLQKGEYSPAGGSVDEGEPGDDKQHLLARREDSALQAGGAAGVALGAQGAKEAGALD